MKVKDTRPLVGKLVQLTRKLDGRQVVGILETAGSISTFIKHSNGFLTGYSNVDWSIQAATEGETV